MTRITAWFDSRASLLEAVGVARRSGVAIVTAILPAYDEELVGAIGVRPRTGLFASVAAGVGAVAALSVMSSAVRQWPSLIISGKPLLAWPTFVIVAFEIAVLSAVLVAGIAFLLRIRRARRAVRGFHLAGSDAAFALLVTCIPERSAEIERLFQQHGAVACHVR